MAGRAGVQQSRLQHPQSGIRRRDAGQVRAAGGAAADSGCRCPETEDGAHGAEKARREIENEAHRAEKGTLIRMDRMLRRIALATTALILVAQFSGPSVRAEPTDKPIGILLAAGDIAECKVVRGRVRSADGYRQQDTADLLGKEISAANAAGIPIRVLALGDLAYKAGKKDEFENCFHKSWGRHIKFILPVPGNHEYKSSNEATPYFDYFEKQIPVIWA